MNYHLKIQGSNVLFVLMFELNIPPYLLDFSKWHHNNGYQNYNYLNILTNIGKKKTKSCFKNLIVAVRKGINVIYFFSTKVREQVLFFNLLPNLKKGKLFTKLT